jgi:hypothetical protein
MPVLLPPPLLRLSTVDSVRRCRICVVALQSSQAASHPLPVSLPVSLLMPLPWTALCCFTSPHTVPVSLDVLLGHSQRPLCMPCTGSPPALPSYTASPPFVASLPSSRNPLSSHLSSIGLCRSYSLFLHRARQIRRSIFLWLPLIRSGHYPLWMVSAHCQL